MRLLNDKQMGALLKVYRTGSYYGIHHSTWESLRRRGFVEEHHRKAYGADLTEFGWAFYCGVQQATS